MGEFVWLASYPKSGNTWFRVLLTNYFRNEEKPADINQLLGSPAAAVRNRFDEFAGVEASELTEDEQERLRPAVYRRWAAEHDEAIFTKVHDAFTYTSSGEPLLPKEVTRAAIYLIRNPLDVAISYSRHFCLSIDRAISDLAKSDSTLAICGKRLELQLRQRLLSWSEHVRSWVDEPGLNVSVVRFEDLRRDTAGTFARAMREAGFTIDLERARRAADYSELSKLQKQEQEKGFKERVVARAPQFFFKGEAGGWRNVLTPEQVERICCDHGEVMRRFGYYPEA